jgi:hypothetical protein
MRMHCPSVATGSLAAPQITGCAEQLQRTHLAVRLLVDHALSAWQLTG